jgi:hypothetical protein
MVVIYFVARQLITSAAGGTDAVGAIVGAYFGDFAIASLILAGAGVLGWIAASRVAAGPRARPAVDAPKRRERAPRRAAAGGLLKRREPAAPPREPAPPPEPVRAEPDGGSEDRTEVLRRQRARTDIPTIRVPSRDVPPPQAEFTAPPQAESTERATKTCPDCAETVLEAARVCKHCGYRFDPGQ